MKLILVRHGQTNANAKRLVQGRIDNPLNRVGIKQAKDAGKIIKKANLEIDIIASSPLSRALETAQLIARKLNYKENIYIEPQMVERDFKPFEMKTIKEVFPQIINTNFKHELYEDDKRLENRISNAVYRLSEKFNGKTVLFSAHAHVIRALYCIINPDKYDYANHYLGNTSIHIFDVSNNDIKLLDTLNNEEPK